MLQCRRCGERKPKDDAFHPRRRVCNTCHRKQLDDLNARNKNPLYKKHPSIEAKKHAHLIVDPGPPPPPEPRQRKKKKKGAKVSFTGRKDAETYVADQIMSDIAALDDLIERYEGLYDETMIVREQKDISARIEACVQKRVDLSMRLVKSFDLFSDLGRPVDADPVYTPVTFVLNAVMPPSCIVQDKFARDPEMIQQQEALDDGDSGPASEN